MIRRKKPVIIYFYGGSFENGHGTTELYQPAHLVQNNDIIVYYMQLSFRRIGIFRLVIF